MSNHELLHALWTKAVGTPGYDKSEWAELEAQIESAKHLLTARIGEAAFPETITIRDQFAMAALAATENWMQDRVESYPHMATRIFLMADAMMEARKK